MEKGVDENVKSGRLNQHQQRHSIDWNGVFLTYIFFSYHSLTFFYVVYRAHGFRISEHINTVYSIVMSSSFSRPCECLFHWQTLHWLTGGFMTQNNQIVHAFQIQINEIYENVWMPHPKYLVDWLMIDFDSMNFFFLKFRKITISYFQDELKLEFNTRKWVLGLRTLTDLWKVVIMS